MTMYHTYYDPDDHNEQEHSSRPTYRYAGSIPSEPPKKPKKKMSYLKKLGLTASLAAVFGLVGSGVFLGVNALATDKAAVSEAAAGETDGELPALPDKQPGESDDAGVPKSGASDNKSAGKADGAIASGDDKAEAGTLENKEQNSGEILSVALTGSEMSTADIAEAVMPSMVAITNTSVQEIQNYYGGMFGGMFGMDPFSQGGEPQEIESTAMGTGVIIDQDADYLYIVTNQHVIANARELSVAFVDEAAAAAEVVGEDETNDLAVIKVALKDLSSDTLGAIRVAEMGSSDALTVGQDVIAIGNALGYGQSVSVGIVSALGRTMDGGECVYAEGLIQTDAAINPGNSGGALLNDSGELIGINSAKYASTEIEGMGYAIPIDTAYPIVHSMIAGTYEEPSDDPFGGQGNDHVELSSGAYLGISCTGISAEYAQYYNIPEGVYIAEVSPDGAADKAGLQAGDIILTLDNKAVSSVDDLTSVLNDHEPGDTVTAKVARESGSRGNYVTGELEITLGSRPEV